MKKELFDITGMTCSACSARVHKIASELPGVHNVSVNLLKNSMSVEFDDPATAETISHAVQQGGYGATLRASHTRGGSAQGPAPDVFTLELLAMKRRLIVSLACAVPLFYLSMGHMLSWPLPGFFLGTAHTLNFAFTQFLLLLPVLFVNRSYFSGGFRGLFAGAPNMDSLIAIGSGAASIYGIYAIYRIGTALGSGELATAHAFAMDLYFESAGVILTLITLGKFFESRAKSRTSDAIAGLMDLAPKTARVLRDGSEEEISREDVVAGDMLVVKTGESVPVDGVITQGQAQVDESALTGESIPSEKGEGDPVTGGTIAVSGHFIMLATRVGDDTTLAQIIRLVDEATSSKAPVARLADTISGIFVPVVIVIAFVAVAAWLFLGYGIEFALSIGIAVLVISCPCALGLATPTAIMAGTGRGASRGILFKSAEAIELAQSVDTVILDKTGTVTEGVPSVTDVLPADNTERSELLGIAASLERFSEHPLGKAIMKEAGQENIILREVTEFSQTPGQGISGKIGGSPCLAGNARMLETLGLVPSGAAATQAQAFAEQGKTVLYIVRDNILLGVIAIADTIKKSSPQAVAELAGMGIDVIMMTGDNARTAAAIQQQTGITHVLAEVLPEDKERKVRTLQEQGKKVAMVGDGVNDAPALARADVGIAVGAGTDVAIESADIVLMKSDLLDVAEAIQLSKAVMRIIRQNLFWAFFYNSVGIPIAAGVFYAAWGLTLNPMIAAAAMGLSSISVVTNALRLRGFTPTFHHYQGILPDVCDNHSPCASKESAAMQKVMNIDGMSCGHCSASVEKALKALPGVVDAKVDLEAKNALVSLEDSVSDQTLAKAVTDAGFTVLEVR